MKIDDQTYEFEGKTTLIDFCRIIEEDENIFDKVKGESDSLAGLILELKGEIPNIHDSVKFDKFQFVVADVNNRRIKQIKVIIEK